MTKLINTSVYSLLLVFICSSHSFPLEQYPEAMQKSISAVYHASDLAGLREAVNGLERIANAEKNKWEPHYYIAFGYLMMANLEHDAVKKDVFLDRAMIAVEKAKTLAGQESEIIALEGFVYMMRVTVDPAARGAEFAPMAMKAFAKATAINPENPRALGLMAQMQYGSAQFFKAPTTEACALAEQALKKFDSYKPGNPLAPLWGKTMVETLREKCR
jgi:hypothetical protein